MQFENLKKKGLSQRSSNLSLSEELKIALKKAVELIKKEGVIVCPTDTVYGLLAKASSKRAVGRVFQIKKRTKSRPLPIFVKDIKAAKKLALIDKKQEAFLKSVWPGKVTVVLKRKKGGLKLYGLDKKTIALRIPDCKIVNDLLFAVNFPLTGTSANISGQPASTRIKKVVSQFQNQKSRPGLVIDSGNLKPARPSKVIDLTGAKPKILRK